MTYFIDCDFILFNMRKKVNGEVRNKERTKKVLIEAVGKILLEEGYHKIGVNKVAKKAGVDKKLIYRYFGGLDFLLHSYFREKDFWTTLNNELFEGFDLFVNDKGKAVNYLTQLMSRLNKMEEARKIILWEVSEKNKILQELSFERELMGEELFKMTDLHFENSSIDLRACYALRRGVLSFITY